MQMSALETKWQSALRKHISGVFVREDRSIPEEDILPFLGIYMIPDDRMQDYIRYVLDVRFDFMERERLPDANLLPCTASQTRECYPEIWAAQKELRRSGSARKAKAAPRKKSPVKKTARRAQTVSH